MKKIMVFMVVILSVFTLFSCENKVDLDYKENPYIKSAKEKHDIAITSINFTIYINPTYGDTPYSQIDTEVITMFEKMKKSDLCQSVDWLGISYVETSIGPKMIIFPRFIGKEQVLFDAIKVVDIFDNTNIEIIKETFIDNIIDVKNVDLESLSFTGVTSYYQTNQFQCPNSGFIGLEIAPHQYYSKSLKPEQLNKNNFVYHFSVPLIKKEDRKPLWVSLSDYINYRIWFTDEGMFIAESGKDIKERYIYPYVKDVEPLM